ncbi:Centromere-binding protein 1 [Leucoagaricus sp. SymC.cos]|nr:Centromere-binding protein 1 [Leucoagaricus sp. SymC.cos]
MAPTNQPNHDPALAQPPPNPPQAPAAQPQVAPAIPPAPDLSNLHLPGIDQNQIMSLLRHLPGVFGKVSVWNPKEDAAQALSNLAAHPVFGPPPVHYPPPPGTSTGLPGINDPGPSSHPRGPPNLGQLSAVALQATPAAAQAQRPEGSPSDERSVQQLQQAAQHVQAITTNTGDADKAATSPGTPTTTTSAGGRRRNPAMGSDEWTRQRKDNHKEVERRRRGNINEGINELGRIVPSGNGEKAKGAILARSVQYIHHLKENEARNIEKWTLEKLLMDQAMGDLQNQLEEVKRMWEEERNARQRLELELENLRNSTKASLEIQAIRNGAKVAAPATDAPPVAPQSQAVKSPEATTTESSAGAKRKSEEVLEQTSASGATEGEGEQNGKRQRTE